MSSTIFCLSIIIVLMRVARYATVNGMVSPANADPQPLLLDPTRSGASLYRKRPIVGSRALQGLTQSTLNLCPGLLPAWYSMLIYEDQDFLINRNSKYCLTGTPEPHILAGSNLEKGE
jgi:hypothetical protein